MSSKRGIRRHQCEGKVRHASKGAALGAIRSLNRFQYRGTMQAYKCKFCGGFWHIGHLTRDARQARRIKIYGE